MNEVTLLLRPAWQHGESFSGYVERLFECNGLTMPYATTRLLAKTSSLKDCAEVKSLAERVLTSLGIPHYQTSLDRWCDFRREGDGLMQLRYRPKNHCPTCMADLGFRPAIWDLPGFDRCPIHGTWIEQNWLTGTARSRDMNEFKARAKTLIANALAEGSTVWLPKNYSLPRTMTLLPPRSVSDVYKTIATLAFLEQEVRYRSARISAPMDTIKAVGKVLSQASTAIHWLYLTVEELEADVLREANLAPLTNHASAWGWSPYLLRITQVGSCLADSELPAPLQEMLARLGRVAAENCLYRDQYLTGHQHADALPTLESLAVVCPNVNHSVHAGYKDYLQLFARIYGIPALGYGPGGIVVRGCDIPDFAERLIGKNSSAGTIYTAENALRPGNAAAVASSRRGR